MIKDSSGIAGIVRLDDSVEFGIYTVDEVFQHIRTIQSSDYTTENKQEDEAEWIYKLAVDNGVELVLDSDDYVVKYLNDNGIKAQKSKG